MTQKDLALALGTLWVGVWISFSKFVVGLNVNLRSLLECAKVIEGIRVEAYNMVP